ncbi:nucleotide-binding domain-containing protein [Cutaneotrichosporon oleaginosum]|uniref:NADPH:adrenodoxin oxidoreductase, mitochondrial n=1 Tax=Cutaneotrichosporon oleaginosum TaxID=879819 RepID=A0A0J0XXR7_9TREE|nr:nucleotide-binding domain-containing protein [Cutaneotrichosporon oleaginosum]KLT45851.1 nucleotide-binding domain-containing protein [Cutaneotrichosporon oleaginosum]TXT06554.1 hypothetical protein COLE_05885 [Cutaneotrichosporon oleaginosum]
MLRLRRSLRLSRTLRAYSTAPSAPLKVAVIGAGPSGFYAASRILQLLPASSDPGSRVQVDMYERLPTPYGLVRYGVAPDHPEVKNCQHKFDELASDARFNFFGNVSVGTPPPSESRDRLSSYSYPHALHLPLSDVAAHYNALIFSYGASLSNPLASVSGSSSSDTPLANVYPALAFVGWYNGHPAFADLNPDLSAIRDVDVVGQGNVALDVARILLSPLSALEKSDLPQNVLDTLAKSTVERVRAVGRRGPAQVAFTTKELREMVKLGVNFPGVDAGLMAQAKAMAQGDRARTRMLGLMEKPVVGGSKTFELAFLRSPTAFLPDAAGRVAGVEWAINELVEGERGVVARATDAREMSVAQMVVESVGYRSEPIDGASTIAPFDTARGRLRNDAGRVLDDTGHVNGAYAAGWVARGPVGVIATTMQDAYLLVDRLLEDYGEGWADRPADSPIPVTPQAGVPDAIERGLKDGTVVDIPRWLKIDAAERERGKKTGREEREKFRTVAEMLEVLG